jgi:hypothetical protein
MVVTVEVGRIVIVVGTIVAELDLVTVLVVTPIEKDEDRLLAEETVVVLRVVVANAVTEDRETVVSTVVAVACMVDVRLEVEDTSMEDQARFDDTLLLEVDTGIGMQLAVLA